MFGDQAWSTGVGSLPSLTEHVEHKQTFTVDSGGYALPPTSPDRVLAKFRSMGLLSSC